MTSRIYLLLILTTFVAVVYADTTGRIVGGYDANPAEFPYQISLRRNGSHGCGGSIISKRFVLTAAHCVVESGTTPYDAKYFSVLAGTNNRFADGTIIQVKRIIVHEGYIIGNDLALLELAEDLVWSKTILPIELMEETVPTGSEVIISGWGLLVDGGDSLPIILQYNKVTVLSKLQCSSKIGFYMDSVICLDHPKGAGACNGDSGGPAIYNGKLCGVASFVVQGCGGSRPDGYAKVSYNIKWIRENMQ